MIFWAVREVKVGVGGMVLIFGRVPDFELGFFISKIITQQYRFKAKKGSLSVFGG